VDGLRRIGIMPGVDLKPLEETCPPSLSLRRGGRVFRASVFKMLKKEGKIGDDLINRLMSSRHSGFSVHNGVRVRRDDDEGREALAQYIIRNTFSVEKLTYINETATVSYRSKMSHGNNSKKNLEVYTAEKFIAAITQHIPEKSFQMVRYYGWYSNVSRGKCKRSDQDELIPYILEPDGSSKE